MKIVIELWNSLACSIDSQVVNLVEGEDTDDQIKLAVLTFVSDAIISPGDTIKISEIH